MKKILWLLPVIVFSLRGAEAKTVDRILVQVNDEIITLSELNREMAQYRKELAAKYTGEQLEEVLQKAEKQVLETLIQEKLLYQKAAELGFGANVEARVSAYIQQLMKENNIKDTDELSTALEQQGFTLKDYREQLRKRIMRDDLVNELVGSRITLLTPEIEKYYKDHAAEFTTPEEVTLSEIIVASQGDDKGAESRANDLVGRHQKGESFSSLASQYSSGPTANKGGSIGTYVLAKLNPDTVSTIANVREGEVSKPQKIKEGYVIYRVDKRKPSYVRPLDEVKTEIRNQLYQRKFAPELERYINQLRQDAYVQFFSEIK
jgi:peptidyl-prolyl cis-trans isomerase SurA